MQQLVLERPPDSDHDPVYQGLEWREEALRSESSHALDPRLGIPLPNPSARQ